MKLNCKENDLAIIVRTNGDPDLKPHLGKIIKLQGPVEFWYEQPVWRYEGPYLRNSTGWNVARIVDSCLKPLDAELDGEDLFLDVPTESEFLDENPDFREIPAIISNIL